VIAAFVVASLVLFVFPEQDDPGPRSADAVVVLSGTFSSRIDKGLELMRRRVAPLLVISGWPDPRYHRVAPYCRRPHAWPFRVSCFMPEPYSTRGEAEEIARRARAGHWRTVVVVTSTYHVFRAGMVFRRCTRTRVEVVGARPSVVHWFEGVFQEWGKLVYQLTAERSC
jgi:uncharacterized SAM-binding protein YcdF (DUF218 family)